MSRTKGGAVTFDRSPRMVAIDFESVDWYYYHWALTREFRQHGVNISGKAEGNSNAGPWGLVAQHTEMKSFNLDRLPTREASAIIGIERTGTSHPSDSVIVEWKPKQLKLQGSVFEMNVR